MKVRITQRSGVPEDRPTWADLSTLPLEPKRAGWGVRVPLAQRAASGDHVTVVHLCGKVTDVTLAEKIYENDRFTYWREDSSLDPDGGEARAGGFVWGPECVYETQDPCDPWDGDGMYETQG